MSFAEQLVAWQRREGRHDLPWQGTRDPYRIWLSEVMLQQTQVTAVIPYYERFLKRFPSIDALARAEEDEVLQLWSGLGYYARGRNLHAAAKHIAANGFPGNAKDLEALPGVGRSTAAAIAVFAFGERAAILDGNAKRVLARVFGVGEPGWELAERHLPAKDVAPYTQALMDLGATVCTRRPACASCPVKRRCVARREERIDELPAPRPKKVLPLRQTTWLVQRCGDEVLLERRPSSGIWGGLWCFPEKKATGRKLAAIEHGFTHFRLRIQPVLRELRKKAPAGPAQRWMRIAEAASAALPTPVRNLIGLLR
ncbi:MAG: A/G-specific adenine glycosylase [Betaproteobacteria bacterium]|jgi:A/G-specific adenine glycosylase|nr:A/G-specific adenine glycosylase [Betaproteobacteria bacterium]